MINGTSHSNKKREPTVERDNYHHKDQIIVQGDVINSKPPHGLDDQFQEGLLLCPQ